MRELRRSFVDEEVVGIRKRRVFVGFQKPLEAFVVDGGLLLTGVGDRQKLAAGGELKDFGGYAVRVVDAHPRFGRVALGERVGGLVERG